MCAFPRKLSLARGGLLIVIAIFAMLRAQLGNILLL